ncbi:MAG: DUF3987 domain-containing protein [Prevotella sp.]|nr:DUF3987 domain-containing protein [Prevotella sp.]
MRRRQLSMVTTINANKSKVFEASLDTYFKTTASAGVCHLIDKIRESSDADERRRLKSQLPFRCPHYFKFKDGHRSQDCILPEEFTWQTCIDIDDERDVQTALSRAHLLNNNEGEWKGKLLHAENSPSGKLHLDIRIPLGMTIEEAQMAYCKALGVAYDESCISPERMIYLSDWTSQLYTSDDWYARLSDEEIAQRQKAYTDRGLDIDGRPVSSPKFLAEPSGKAERGEARRGLNEGMTETVSAAVSAAVQTTPTPPNSGGEKGYPQDYKGIPYSYIVEELADQLGGAPEHGSRNDFIFLMACHLRHVCNDDPQWIRSILPNYGEAQDRVDDTIRSACQRNQAPGLSKKIELTLDFCRRRLNAEGGTEESRVLMAEPKMPERLPVPIKLLTSKAPAMYRPAIATAIFPALATRLGGDVKLEYWDNTEMEAALMACVLAEFSGGKSCIKQPISLILEKLEKEGRENRQKLKEYNDMVNAKGANKDKPQRPDDICIQVVDSNMTNAALVRLLEDAERAGNKYLFTRMDELEMLKQVGNGSIDHVTEIIRRAFDTDLYGQERVGSQSVTARTPLRWNFTVSSTQDNAVRFFGKHIANGTFSRLNVCTIVEDKTVDFPVFGKYDDHLRSRLAPYLQMLDEAKGLIVCSQAKRLAKELALEAKDRAVMMDNESYEKISRRAVVIAFRKACILYAMNGMRWSKDIEEFVRWSFYYDMWCKMRLFGQAMELQLEKERAVINIGTPNMLDLLNERFTREELKTVRRQLGKKENPKDQLGQWTRRGLIYHDEKTDEYVKSEKYLKRRVA